MPWTVPLMLFTLLLSLAANDTRGAAPVRGAAPHPPVAAADGPACTQCHEGVTNHRVVHGPVAAGKCSTCHVVTGDAGNRRIALARGVSPKSTAPLCLTCHEDIAGRLTERHRHAPVAAGDCTACHDPHGSPFRFQLADEGNRACTRCHADIAEALAASHVHAPAAMSCQICHDAHAASRPAQLRAAANTVCVACHVDAPIDTALVDEGSVFGRHPANGVPRLVERAPRILLDGSLTAGHPTVRHPVDGRPDPTAKGRTLGCTSCHNPHGSRGAPLLRFGATGVSALCIRCHSF